VPADGDLLFGKLAVSRGYCAQESIEWCVAIQETSKDRLHLGRILVNEGYLTEEQHSEILALQRKNLSAVDPVAKKSKESVLFGKLVVREGLLSSEAVNACLADQAKSGEKRSLGGNGHFGASRSAERAGLCLLRRNVYFLPSILS
jgi:hypothetical protein